MTKRFAIGTALTLGLLLGTAAVNFAEGDKPNAKKPAEVARPIVWTDINGNGYGPTQLRGSAATVFLFVSSECPLVRAYVGRLRTLEKEYAGRRVSFFLVNAHPTDTIDIAKTWSRERNLTIPIVKDVGALLTDRLGATRTPEAVVVDRAGNVAYRGRIDDHIDEAKVQHRYLREALDAIIVGKPAPKATVGMADGCLILRPTAPTTAKVKATVTYSQSVASILNKNCVSCHREGEVAPFRLDTYAQAKLWAPMIADVAKRRIMPPWKATPGYGDFHNNRSLTDDEVATLTRWAETGAPVGNLAAAPKPPTFPGDWSGGKPDLILRPERPYKVAGEGKDEYRCFVLPAEFTKDTYVKISQIKPGNRTIVHHIIVYVDPSGKAALEADAKEPGDGFINPRAGAGDPVDGAYWLTGWAPGGFVSPPPEGVVVPVPKGARLIMEVHYHRSGKDEIDQSALGLTFARDTVKQFSQMSGVSAYSLQLKPGEANIQVSNSVTLPQDYTLRSVAPHMHQIGKEMHIWAVKPDGVKEELIWLKNWDFQWQTAYDYRKPVSLPKGTKLYLEAVFDNSAENPRNPNRPPKLITWGEASTDEMCIGFMFGTADNQKLNITPSPWQETVTVLPEGAIARQVEAVQAALKAPVADTKPMGPNLLHAKGDASDWMLFVQPGETAELAIERENDGSMRAEVRALGKESWHLQLLQTGLKLEPNHRYTLEFQARADQDRSMIVNVQKNVPNYESVGLNQSVKLTTEWKTYRYTFTTNAAVVPDQSSLTFLLGQSKGKVWVKDARLQGQE